MPLTIEEIKQKKSKYLSINELFELIQNTHYFLYPIITIRYVGPMGATAFAEPFNNKHLIKRDEVLDIGVKETQDNEGYIYVNGKGFYLPSNWYVYESYGNKYNIIMDNNVKIFRYINADIVEDCEKADEELRELAEELEKESVKKESNDKIIREINEDISIINTALINNSICENQRSAAGGGKSRKTRRGKTKRGKTRRGKRRSSKRRR